MWLFNFYFRVHKWNGIGYQKFLSVVNFNGNVE